jgi:hypothetical protein
MLYADVNIAAQQYRTEHLEDKYLYRLHEDLISFEITSKTNTDVIELLQHTCRTSTRLVDRQEGLRMLVRSTHRLSCVYESMTS